MAAQVGLSATTSTAWSAVTPATNANAGNFNMGNGTVLGPTGTGVVNANQVNGATIPVSQTSLASDSSGHIIAGSGGGDWINIGSSVTFTPSGSMAGSFASGAFTVSTAGTVLTITSIPGTYKNLYLKVKGTTASTNNISVQLNGDTANNYAWACNQFNVSSNTSATNCGTSTSTNAIGNAFLLQTLTAQGTLEIDGYTDGFAKATTTIGDYWASVSSGTNDQAYRTWGLWNSTAAITSITLTCGSNCSVNDQFMLYASK